MAIIEHGCMYVRVTDGDYVANIDATVTGQLCRSEHTIKELTHAYELLDAARAQVLQSKTHIQELQAICNSQKAKLDAERAKWIDATTGFDDEGDIVCNVCLSWCQPDEEIIHTDDCPAKEESDGE